MTDNNSNQIPNPPTPIQSSQNTSSQHVSNTTPTHQASHQTTPPSKIISKTGKRKSGTPRTTPRFSKQEVDSKGIPIDFKDPISQLIMSDPVSTAAGSTYERESIERWLDTSDVDPITGTKLKSKLVYPNNALKNQISLFLEAQPKFKQYVCTQGEYTLERIENLLKDENNIHEITKLIRKAAILTKKEIKQNILHIMFENSCCVGYIEKILEQKVIQDQLQVLLSQKDVNGRLPFTLGALNNIFEVFKYCATHYTKELLSESEINLWEDESKRTILAEHLMDCCSEGFLEGVKVLHHFKVPLDYRLEYSSFFPIEEAAYGGYLSVMDFIYENSKVPIEHINRALGSASEGHKVECIKFCLEKGADINFSEGFPPAISRAVGDLQTLMFLVSHGADVNIQVSNTEGEPETPLSFAAQIIDDDNTEESLKVIDYLLEQGANIDHQDSKGWAAIHYAARAYNKELLGKLIENECNVDLLTSNKQSVYDIIDEMADTDIIGDEDSITDEEDRDEDDRSFIEENEGLPTEDVIPLSPTASQEGIEEDPYVYLDNDDIIIDDEDEDDDISQDEYSPESIKKFIREHSALVKRLRQSMTNRDVSNISKGLNQLEKKYADIISLISYQSELLKRICEKSNIDVEVENLSATQTEVIEDSVSKKRKRKKSIGPQQKNKKKRFNGAV